MYKINYAGICQEKYKLGVINTLLTRAYTVSSNWKLFCNEAERIRQKLTNNNFPMAIIDAENNKFVNKIMMNEPLDNKTCVELYYSNQMTPN